MNRFDFIESVETLKKGSSKTIGFKLVKPKNFDGVQNQKVVDVWLLEMEDYFHAIKIGQQSAMELAQSYLRGYVST
jgi:hypothetical protein